jgi:hypothetical protein
MQKTQSVGARHAVPSEITFVGSSFENWGVVWQFLDRHSRMLLAGIQGNFGLDPRLKRSGCGRA